MARFLQSRPILRTLTRLAIFALNFFRCSIGLFGGLGEKSELLPLDIVMTFAKLVAHQHLPLVVG